MQIIVATIKNNMTKIASPVVSFLSPSPSASRKAQVLLASLCGLQEVQLPSFQKQDDRLNASFESFLPRFSKSWDSVALKCNYTGTLVHFCSEYSNSGGESSRKQPFALLGITHTANEDSSEQAVQSFRDLLASKVQQRSSFIKFKHSFGSLSPEELLRDVSRGGLPLVSVPSPKHEVSEQTPPAGLKEVVVPFFDFSEYADGSSFLSHFAEARRPVVGVYQWGDCATRIRPLPTASEDRRLPPPSLVFHCNDSEEIEPENSGARTAKIGYRGNKMGQLMLQHEDLLGLDIRFCSSTKVSSAFSEAQDSLLAGSLNELQSTNTLLVGGEKAKDDDRIGQSDCWVEVRANLKSPSGFLKRPTGSVPSKQKLASINTPDS
jgi:hypothetical protein